VFDNRGGFFWMKVLAGIDIGGTKCAVSLGKLHNNDIQIIDRVSFATFHQPEKNIEVLIQLLEEMVDKNQIQNLASIGISCGGPMDSSKGLILSPPNLPSWDHIQVVEPFAKHFGISCKLENDANACGLAEWYFGAGKGKENIIFLTFGTGLGAGLILNGKLYRGSSDMAGEIGHIRLKSKGPLGYGKFGSFEGFCSGGGIAYYANQKKEEWKNEFKESTILECEPITAKDIGLAASEGDQLAIEILETVGKNLGQGVSMLIDLLNPEMIIIGSIFLRTEQFLRKSMETVISQETLSISRKACQIVAAGLKEEVGDYAALSVAMNILND
jgi:glucokinase